MIEEQLVFFVFSSVFGLLSILKTLQKYWDTEAETKNEPQRSCQNDENAIIKSPNIFSISDKCVEQINNTNTNTTEFKNLGNFQKTKRKPLVKSILNYSIAFNSSFMIVGGLTESYLYVGDPIFTKILEISN